MRVFINVSKRMLSLSLALIMVLAMVPSTVFQVYAATVTLGIDGLTASDLNGKWSWSNSTLTGSVTGTAASGCTSAATTTDTLTLTNTGAAATLSFDYTVTLNSGSITVDGVGKTEGGSFTKELEPNDSINIVLTSAKGNYTTSMTITNLKLELKPVEIITTTFKIATNGSYTVNGTAITKDTELKQGSDVAYNVVATPASGYIFVGWWDVTTASYISSNASASFYRAKASTVEPRFAPADTAQFGVDSMTFYDLNEANAYAASKGGAQINLLNNGVLYAGSYTISAKNTLLVPFDSAYTCYKEEPAKVNNSYEKPTVFRTLTMVNGASITVEGAISVSAKHDAAGGSKNSVGSPTGPYGRITMNSGSTITVKNGGNLYAWGFITGDGEITAESGATVWENLQVADFRGGNGTKNAVSLQTVFPFSQYFVQNIEVKLTLMHGAKENAYTSINMSYLAWSASVNFIGSSDCMFTTTPGSYVVKDYDPTTDRLMLDAYGDMGLNGVKLGIAGINIDSSMYDLPITNNLTIRIHSGTTTLSQNIAVLPGAEVSIDEGATVNIPEGKKMYIYDADQWFAKYVFKSEPSSGVKLVAFTPTGIRTRANSKPADAKVDVNGTVIVNGELYTTAAGAAIVSSQGTGWVQLTKPPFKDTVTYQALQDSDNNITHEEIPINSAWLRNADGTYVETKDAEENEIYLHDGSKWYKDFSVTFDPNGGEGTLNLEDVWGNDLEGTSIPITNNDVYVAEWSWISFPENTFSKEGYTPLEGKEWNEKADGTGKSYTVGDEYSATGPVTFYAQWDPNDYTVTFDPNGGESTMTAQTVEHLVEEALTANVFTREGYNFTGWNTAADGSGTTYTDKAKVALTGNTTLYAQWKLKEYPVTFYANGGEGTMSAQTVEHGVAENLDENTFTKTGYSFNGWNTEANGSGTSYADRASVTRTSPLSLYAQWKANNYKINWVNGDTTNTVDVTYDADFSLPSEPTQEGYTFQGWYTNQTGGTKVAAGKYTTAGDSIYYAQFTVNSYTLTWVIDGVTTTKQVNYGATITAPAEPTKQGYTFTGWEGEIPGTMPAEDTTITLTSKWTPADNRYTVETYTMGLDGKYGEPVEEIESAKTEAQVSVNPEAKTGFTVAETSVLSGEVAADGSTVLKVYYSRNQYKVTWNVDGEESEETYYYGADIVKPADPTKQGYTFTGWKGEIPETMPAEAITITLTSKWTPADNRYTVKTYTMGLDGKYGEPVEEIESAKTEAQVSVNPEAKTGFTVAETSVLSGEVAADGSTVLKVYYSRNQYKVTWNVDGEQSEETYYYGADIVKPADPTKQGYTFNGWGDYTDGMTMGTADVTFTARWEANPYDAIFKADGGAWADGATIKTVTTAFDSAIVKPADPTRTGYTFAGWTPEVGNMTNVNGMTFTALWEANPYDAIFDANDGAWADGETSKTVTTLYDTPIMVPEEEPAREGYTFAGWTPEVGNMTEEGMTFTAQWTVNTYQITLTGEGVETSTITVTYGKTYADGGLTEPVRTGYTFKGWYAGEDKVEPTDTVPANPPTSLTAKWTATAYTITYSVPEDATHNNGGGYNVEDLPLTLNDASKEGYIFQGWTCEELNITVPTKGMQIPVGTTENLNVKAHFVLAVASVTSGGETVNYPSLGAAYVAANAGDTITLLVDATGAGLVINKNITIDFNNHAYTVNYAVGSSGTQTLGLQILNGSQVTLKNGTLTANDGVNAQGKVVKMLIQNYADLTLDGMTLTANENTLYCLSINSGGVKINNSTITAAEGKVAFDACKYGSYDAPTVEATNCTVTGIVEVTGGDVTVENGTYTSNDTDVFIVSSGKLTIDGNPTVSGGSKDGSTAVWAKDEGRVVINGGNFTVGADANTVAGYNDLIYARDKAVVEITGGHFDGPARTSDGQKFLLNLKDNSNAQIIVKGGTYVGFDPQDSGTEPAGVDDNFVAEGYIAANDVDNTFTVKAHTHAYNYTASDETIVQKCHDGCRHSAEAKLVLNSEVSLVYTGSEIMPYGVEHSENWAGAKLNVQYQNNVNAGTATARISVGNATASADFTIANANLTDVSVSQKETLTYNKEAQTAKVTTAATAVNDQTVTFTYSAEQEGKYTAAVPAFTDAGTYTVYYKATAPSHNEASGSFTVTIGSAVPEYTVPTGLKAASGCTLSDVALPEGWSWVDSAANVGAVGERTHQAVFTPSDTKNYKTVTVAVTIEVFRPTITFVTAGGSEIAPIAQDYNTVVEAPAEPTKEGHTFAGWKDAEGNAAQIPAKMPATNLTLYAQWTVNEYTITFANTGDTAMEVMTVKFDEVIRVSDPSKTGYTFAGWTITDENGNAVEIVDGKMPAKNLTYTAQWKINQYTLTLMDGETTIVTINYNYDAIINISFNRTKEGHTFAGWKDAEGNDAQIPAKMPATNLTLYAQWTVNEYTITFANTGDTVMEDMKVKFDEEIRVSDPSKTGYTFAGWTITDENGTEITLVDNKMPAMDLAYTANWTINSYDIHWDTDGDGAADDTTKVEFDRVPEHADGFKAADKVNTYKFLGWSTEKNGKVLTVLPKVTGEVTYYAVFEAQPITYTVTFDTQGGSNVTALTGGYGATITLPAAPTRTGYTFLGWAETADPNADVMKAGSAYVITDNDTLYGQWKINQYTITFVTDGGTEIDAITQDYGTAVTAPAAPTKTGYTFQGWDKEIPATMPAEDMTFTAQWKINTYTIRWVVEDNVVETDTVEHGTTPEYNGETPTKESSVSTVYTFENWSPVIGPATGDVTYVAQFSESVRSYTITWIVEGEETTTTVDYGVVPTWPNAVPVKAEDNYNTYTFDKWVDSEGNEPVAVTGETTYTAQFTSTAKVYTLTLDLNGGVINGETAIIIQGGYGDAIPTPAVPAKTGYSFAGWEKEIPTTLTETQTIKAKWVINQYTITFDTDGGSETASITQNYNTKVTAPADPTKTGYTFAGWNPAVPTTMPAEDITVKAQWTVNQYTITFDTAGGSDIAPITQNYGSDVTAPENPTKAGYTFKGWTPAVPETMPAENVKLTAIWEANTNTISIYTEPKVEDEEIDPYWVITAKTDEDIQEQMPADPEKEGYTFAGWVDAAGNPAVLPATMPTENMEIYAKWTVDQHTITFDLAGGVIGEATAWAITQDYGTAVTAPEDPTREGYTFDGWNPVVPTTMPAENVNITAQWKLSQYTIFFQDDEGNTLSSATLDYGTVIEVPAVSKTGHTFVSWNEEIPGTMPAHDVVITSTWTVNRYTITFDSNGGSAVDPITADYGTNLTAPEVPVKEGYTFVGWTPAFPETMGAENLMLKAQWKRSQYLITWKNWDGSELGTSTVNHGGLPSYNGIPSKAATAEYSYVFGGWNTKADGSGNALIKATGAATYYAQYDQLPNEYTITFNTNGGSAIPARTLAYGEAVVRPENPTREGYVFIGWDKEIPATMPAENVVVTAQWKKVQYTITFNTDGGSETATIMAGSGDPIFAPADPVKEGHTFVGWFDAQGNAVEIPETMPEGGLELKAKWTLNTYTITFKIGENTVFTTVDVEYGTDLESVMDQIGTPEKKDHTFMGWNNELPETMPAGDLVLVAQWRYSYSGWLTDENGTTYLSDGSKVYFETWAEIDGASYYFNDQGYVLTDIRNVVSQDGTHEGLFAFDQETGVFLDDLTGVYVAESGDRFYVENGEAVANKGLVRTVTEDGVVEYYYFGCDNNGCTDETCRADAYTVRKDCVHWVQKTNNLLLPQNDYTFDENGVIVHHKNTARNGIFTDEKGNECYYIDGVKAYVGLIEINGDYYYVCTNGELIKGTTYWVNKTNGLMSEGSYEFDEDGKMIIGEIKNGIYAEDDSLYYYKDGKRTYAGLIEIDGAYYYVKSNCEAVHGGIFWITKTNGQMKQGSYNFDENGKMIPMPEEEPKFTGIKDGYYYKDGQKYYAGLIQIDGYYYYVNSACKVITGQTYWISKTNGLMPERSYTFDEQGRMVDPMGVKPAPDGEVKNGIVDENGTLYYYENGVLTYAGLIEIDGYLYYVKSDCTAVKDGIFWITKTNGILPQGRYEFDAQGRMVTE